MLPRLLRIVQFSLTPYPLSRLREGELFLKRLPKATIDEIAGLGHDQRLDAGEVLYREADRCLGLIVVVSGLVRSLKIDRRGREMIISVDRPGSSVGDLALFDGGTYPTTAEAGVDGSVVYIVSKSSFDAVTRRHPEIAAEALRTVAIQTRKLIEMLKVQALHSVRARLAAYLLDTAGDERAFPLTETNAAIGHQVGTVREVVSRTLHALEDAGAITLLGRKVVIVDRKVLRDFAENSPAQPTASRTTMGEASTGPTAKRGGI